MHARLRFGLLLGALPTILQPARSQAPSTRSVLSPPTVVSHTAGLDQVDGEWIGVGDGYKVALRTDGFEFVPALGDSAPHDFPIAYQLVAIERDGAAMPPTGAEPRRRQRMHRSSLGYHSCGRLRCNEDFGTGCRRRTLRPSKG